MSFDSGFLDRNLADAVGDDPALVAELRAAFFDSAQRHVSALHNAADDKQWQAAAWRLKGLAASFGAEELMVLAANAAEGAPRDRALLDRIDKLLVGFGQE